jgi:hypothetical protein
MFRHAWAAERLWEGLTAPSDDAWQAGAAALAHAPTAAPKTRNALPSAVLDGLNVVRELGAQGANADTPELKERVYARLLVTCAQCHKHAAKVEF